jgi:hypothetical protein
MRIQPITELKTTRLSSLFIPIADLEGQLPTIWFDNLLLGLTDLAEKLQIIAACYRERRQVKITQVKKHIEISKGEMPKTEHQHVVLPSKSELPSVNV